LLVRDLGGGNGAGTGGLSMLAGFASSLSLQDEAATVGWIHSEVSQGERLPMGEVAAVVRSLSVAMQMEHRMLLPLLDLKRFDQYTTTHACNVSVLAMGLAERLGLGREEVRSFGVAGLLHDLGKIKIPKEILTKPGKLSDDERAVIQAHPVEGARIVLSRERGLGVAAVVAYEHHVCIDGGGYPSFRFARNCHYASRIVHVCDIYDALCTNRPYRDAWEPEKALTYLESRAGTEVDTDITRVFCEMVRGSIPARLPMADEPATA
jgi:putative nucleotidyltransferase with HDIG domain